MEDNPFEIDQGALFTNEEEVDEKTNREAAELLAELGELDDGEEGSKGGKGGPGDASSLGQGVEGLVPLCVQHHSKGAPAVNQAVFGFDIQSMESRPWSRPDANQSDYFNYGFNEKSWRVYCAMHKEGQHSVLVQAEDYAEVSYNKITGGMAGGHHTGHHNPGFGGGANAVMPGQEMGGGMFGGPGGPATVVMPKDHIGYQGQQGGVLAHPPDNHSRGGPAAGGGQYTMGTSLRKTKPCYAFRHGRCEKGDNCNYAHGDSELRAGPPQQPGGPMGPGPVMAVPPHNPGMGGGGGQGLMAPPVPPVMPAPPLPPAGYKAYGGGAADGALFDEPPTKRPRYN